MVLNKCYKSCGHEIRVELYQYGGVFIYKCRSCGLLFTGKIYSGLDCESTYANFYRNETASRFNSATEYFIRLFRFFRAYKIFTIFPKAKSILDVGSGRGFTLFYLRKFFGYIRTTGTQISRNAYEFSRNKLGLEIYDKDLLELPLEDNSFDVVCLWHVLEHLEDPEVYIQKIRDLLVNSGRLVIEVPNFNSWSRRLTGQYWLGLDLKYHLYFFTPASLSLLLKKYGFKVRIIHTFSLEYSTFISVQSLASKITHSDHLVFRHLQSDKVAWPKLVLQGLLFVILTPVCFIINLILYFSKRGEIMLIVGVK